MRNQNSFKLFVSSLIVIASLVANAAWYEDRPSISKVSAKADSKVDDWKIASHGHFLFLAQTLTFFPTSEYYFLARDIEYVYDIAQLMAKDDPVLKQRIHLVPVSTSLSQKTEGMISYLEQEGLTKKKLGSRTALFIDSCCSGSVPDRIHSAFKDRGVNVQGFLIETSEYPSSEMAKRAGADGGAIEDLPHFTESATAYVKDGGKIKIRAGEGSQGQRNQSVAIMGEIRHVFDNAQKRKDFKEIVGLMRIVYSYVVTKTPYKAATRQQAVKALEILAVKHEVPVSDFLTDIRSMNRKGYSDSHTDRIAELKKVSNSFGKAAEAALAKKIVLAPESLNSYLSKTNIQAQKYIQAALETLTESSAKELQITEEKRKQLVVRWLEHYENYGHYNMELNDDTLSKAFGIGYSPAESIQKIFILVRDNNSGSGYYAKFDNRKFSQMVIDVLAQDKYRYEKGSALYELVHNFEDQWEKASGSFRSIMTNVIENASDVLLERLSVDLFKKLPEFSYWKNDSSELQRDINKLMKELVDALPTISKSMITAYLKSSMVKNAEAKYYRDFAKWLFEQREYFDAEALKVPIETEARDVLPGQSKVPPKNVRVEHFVDVHAGPVPIPVMPLKGLKGQLCSRIYSGK